MESKPKFYRAYKPNYVIVAIDTHATMFEKQDNEQMIPFRMCLEALHKYMEDLIFFKSKSNSNPVSVILAGRDNSLIEFKDNLIDSVKLLKSKIELTDEQLKKDYQRQGDLDLAEFFLTCKKIFNKMSLQHKKTFLYITNDECPKVDKFTLFNEAKTFPSSRIAFQLITTREMFNYDAFYNEMFLAMEIESSLQEICIDVGGMIKKLSQFLMKKNYSPQVKLFPFQGDESRPVKCKIVPLVSSKNLINVKMTASGQKVETKKKDISETKFLLKKSDDKEAQEINVEFTKEETEELLDTSYPVGYSVVNLSKRGTDVGVAVANPKVIVPDPKAPMDNFKSMWRQCIEDDVVLVCLYKRTNPGTLYPTELIPINVDKSMGFLCKEIPSINDVKPLSPDLADDVEIDLDNKSKQERVEKLVNALTVDFDFSMIPDLKLRKKRAYVKAKLLGEEVDDEPDEKFSLECDNLSNLISDMVSTVISGSRKRSGENTKYKAAGASKKTKV